MPGPPPEHPHLRLLKGNPGKRAARSPPEAQRADVCPEPPKHLNSYAKRNDEPLPPSCTGPPVVILSPNGDVGMPSRRQGLPPSEGRNKREERRLDTRLLTVADVEAIVAARLAEERGTVIPVLRQAIDELLDAEREHAKSEMAERARGLELQVAKLEAAVSALELALNVERNRVLDLLPLPKRAN